MHLTVSLTGAHPTVEGGGSLDSYPTLHSESGGQGAVILDIFLV